MTEVAAKKKAYAEAIETLKHNKRINGPSSVSSFLRSEFTFALAAVEQNRPDPLDTEVCGIKLADLDLQTVQNLKLQSADEYRQVASGLHRLRYLHGHYDELSQMMIQLEIKAKHFPIQEKDSNV